jgi:hypothetical protein
MAVGTFDRFEFFIPGTDIIEGIYPDFPGSAQKGLPSGCFQVIISVTDWILYNNI